MSHTQSSADDAVPGVEDQLPSARHRVAAGTALVLFAAGAVALVVGAVRGLPWLLVPMVAAGAAAVCLWRALGHRGARRVAYGVATVVLVLVSAMGTAALTRAFPALLVAVVLFVGGGLLSGPALSWVHQPRLRLVRRARRPYLLVNPRSGDGAAERAGLIDAARERGIEVLVLGEDDDLAELARRAVRARADCLGMAGGDGSLALVAGIARDAHIPFVCIPGGTRNHFALDLGLDRSDLVGALDAFGEAVQRRVDLGRVNGRLFVNNVSVGAYGEVVAAEEYRDAKMGTALEAIPDLIGPEAEPLDLRFSDHEGVEHDSALVIHVSNNAYDIGPKFGLAGRPSLDDGALGVVVVLNGTDLGPPRVLQWQAEQFEIRSGHPVAAGIDGEAEELDAPVCFEIVPDALAVRMPRSSLGIAPAARRPPLTTRTVLRLWAVLQGRAPDVLPRSSAESSVA